MCVCERERENSMGGSSLYRGEGAKGRIAYKLYATSMLVGICWILLYRLSHIPVSEGGIKCLAWIGLFGAEFWFAFYWIITQSVRWNPIHYHTFKERLAERYGSELPAVDIFVCTADPVAEPPNLVMSTILSLMAYDYPPEKLSIYLSDDAGSALTFYALWELSTFAKQWLPYCKKFKIEPRSPAAYFAKPYDSQDTGNTSEWSSMKNLYEEMTHRIDDVVAFGKIPEELKKQKGFLEWNSEMTSRNHQAIVQILIDGKGHDSLDMDGKPLPALVYVAREKRPQHHHNFKAGAMNALIRVSSVISNSPIILNVDCDMYSGNSESIRDALCFFLDDRGHDLGYVQYPQYFANITKNDLYGNAFKVVNKVELAGFNSVGGPPYIGTGCFHRRETLCGRVYSKDYKEDWQKAIERKAGESASALEERAMALASCTFEQNTLWGKEIGLKYGCPVEDIITGLSIQCRGWKSICFNPPRRGFLGMAPTTLLTTLQQHKRWGEGNLQIVISKYCSFIQGHGKLKLGLQMGYCIYGLWAPISFPTLYYLTIPSLCLLKGISLFPQISNAWFIPFAYVFIAKHVYSLVESLQSGDTFIGWWYLQRMVVLKRLSAYLYGTMDAILKVMGFSNLAFAITAKVADEDLSKRFEQEMMEFGSWSPMFVIIATVAMLNLVCFTSGTKRLLVDENVRGVDPLLVQVVLCGLTVSISLPIYDAMFLRKDKGRMPPSVTFASLGLVVMACLLLVV